MLISNQPHLLATQEFINGCNIQSETARKQLFDFSTGIYSMGIWNNILFYTTRSSQNKSLGASDFVFAQGGLSRDHGLMVAGPTWGADGITTSVATGSHISSAYDFRPELGGSVISILKMVDLYPGYERRIFYRQNSISAAKVADGNNTYWTARFLGAETSPTVPNLSEVRQTVAAVMAAYGASGTIKCKGKSAYNPSGWENSTTFTTGQSFTHSGNCLFGHNGVVMSFAALCNIELSSNQFDTFYALYKSTLGAGLGLP